MTVTTVLMWLGAAWLVVSIPVAGYVLYHLYRLWKDWA